MRYAYRWQKARTAIEPSAILCRASGSCRRQWSRTPEPLQQPSACWRPSAMQPTPHATRPLRTSLPRMLPCARPMQHVPALKPRRLSFAAVLLRQPRVRTLNIIINMCCQEARCFCRRAAGKGSQNCTPVGFAKSKQKTQSTVGMVLGFYAALCQPVQTLA